jgi:hypothetical protein
MDCHLNCHGELNALLASIPLVTAGIGLIRSKLRAWRLR